MARKSAVLTVIQNFISEHHGTTPVVYFFIKQKIRKTRRLNWKTFAIPAQAPQQRNCNCHVGRYGGSCRRAMSDHAPEKVEALIRKLIREKLDDGQFDDCNLTLRDMNTIAVTFTSVFSGIFHERVKYPNVDLKAERAKQTR